MKDEVAVLGSPSQLVRTISVDVKQHGTNERTLSRHLPTEWSSVTHTSSCRVSLTPPHFAGLLSSYGQLLAGWSVVVPPLNIREQVTLEPERRVRVLGARQRCIR